MKKVQIYGRVKHEKGISEVLFGECFIEQVRMKMTITLVLIS